MKSYKEFHGNMNITMIGKRLREIAKIGDDFKIVTGYGSTSGSCKSKQAAITSLRKMKREKLINCFLGGECKDKILMPGEPFYEEKLKYNSILKNDKDYGNDGVIFVFVKE